MWFCPVKDVKILETIVPIYIPGRGEVTIFGSISQFCGDCLAINEILKVYDMMLWQVGDNFLPFFRIQFTGCDHLSDANIFELWMDTKENCIQEPQTRSKQIRE